jgi:hypothetical protein
MGVDLTICPKTYGSFEDNKWFLAYTRIGLERDYDLFAQIDMPSRPGVRQVCDPKPLPATVRFDWYEDGGVKQRTDDPYGAPLRFVWAEELARVDVGRSSDWNKAALAFVRGLPPRTPIVLWWH